MNAKCKYYWPDTGDGGSADICFCNSECNLKCKRSSKRWFYKACMKKFHYLSVSDFGHTNTTEDIGEPERESQDYVFHYEDEETGEHKKYTNTISAMVIASSMWKVEDEENIF